MKRRIWATKDGRKVSVRRMEDSHLLNAHRMLREKGFVSVRTLSFYIFGPTPDGDGAQDAYEREFNAIIDAPVTPTLDWFDDEIKRRSLSPLPIRTAVAARYRLEEEEAKEAHERELAEIAGPNT